MNVATTIVDVNNTSYEIYLSGCKVKCLGCHNSELWDFTIGEPWKEYFLKYKVFEKIKEAGELISRIVILGGEPLHQDLNELHQFLLELKQLNKELWLFTSYTLIEIANNNQLNELIKHFDYVKFGKYIKELEVENNTQYGYKLATSNQHIELVKK